MKLDSLTPLNSYKLNFEIQINFSFLLISNVVGGVCLFIGSFY